MSDHHHSTTHDSHGSQTGSEPDPADSRADMFALLALVVIAVSAALYFVSGLSPVDLF